MTATMYDVEKMGILGQTWLLPTTHEKIAKWISDPARMETGKTFKQWLQLSKTILPVYHEAILKAGLQPYVYAPDPGSIKDQSTATHRYIWDKTGLDPQDINDYLFSVEKMKTAGAIEAKAWDPRLAPPSKTTAAISTITQEVGEGLERQFNKLLIGGAIVVTAVFLGRTLIEGAFRRRTA